MKIDVENYKGIEFVRISSLPEDQKNMIWSSFNTQKIIKILRDNELLNDCVQYEDYQDWYSKNGININAPQRAKELKLVLNR